MALANRDTRERFGFGRELSRTELSRTERSGTERSGTERSGGRRRVRGARRCRVLKIRPDGGF